MYKNQLQELAQRSCFSLPTYRVISEGPDHGPRYKAWVDFNSEKYESPGYYNTMREAEHAAAEAALTALSRKGTLQVLAARIVAGTGMCKNLLQETAQRAGIPLPIYITTRMGPDHLPVYSSSVEIAGMRFYGESAKTKKQAEKNAAMSAWSALRQSAGANADWTDRQEQAAIVGLFKEAARKAREQFGDAECWLNKPVETRRILLTDPTEALGELEKRVKFGQASPRRFGDIGNFPRPRRPLFLAKVGDNENKVWRPATRGSESPDASGVSNIKSADTSSIAFPTTSTSLPGATPETGAKVVVESNDEIATSVAEGCSSAKGMPNFGVALQAKSSLRANTEDSSSSLPKSLLQAHDSGEGSSQGKHGKQGSRITQAARDVSTSNEAPPSELGE